MHHRCGNHHAFLMVKTASQLLCGSERILNVLKRISQKESADLSVSKLQIVNIFNAIHARTSFNIAPDILTPPKKWTEVANVLLSRNYLGSNFYDWLGTRKLINTKFDESTNIGSHCTLRNCNGHTQTTGSQGSTALEMPAAPGISYTESGPSRRKIEEKAWPHTSYSSQAHYILLYTNRQDMVFL